MGQMHSHCTCQCDGDGVNSYGQVQQVAISDEKSIRTLGDPTLLLPQVEDKQADSQKASPTSQASPASPSNRAQAGTRHSVSSTADSQKASPTSQASPASPSNRAQAGTRHSVSSTAAMRSVSDDQRSDISDASDGSWVSDEEPSDHSAVEASIRKSDSTRGRKKRHHKKLRVMETMGMVPSAALAFVIDNKGALDDFYTIQKVLGKGAFATVKLGTVKATKAKRAIKLIAKEQMRENMAVLKAEIEIMKMVDHPNVVMLYEMFETSSEIQLAMELCPGGSLRDRVKLNPKGRLPEQEVVEAMRQLLRSVYYLQTKLIIHRDLKADNILMKTPATEPLTRCSLKVSDFGLSCVIAEGEILNRKAGTLTHMAPEVLARHYDSRCDIWSCGVIMYYLLSGEYPFRSEEDIKAGKIPLSAPQWADASQAAVDFMKMLLTLDMNKRASCRKALRMPWISGGKSHEVKCPTLIQDLQKFRTFNRFKRSVLSIAASMLEDEQIANSRDLFDIVDGDGDGVISLPDLRASGKVVHTDKTTAAPAALPTKDIKAALRENFTGVEIVKPYTYTEFLAATLPKLCLSQKLLRAAFNCFDKNGDGGISMEELASGHLLGHLSLEELEAILKGNDLDGNKEIDFNEFVEMMTQ